jgi:hypothetical protein
MTRQVINPGGFMRKRVYRTDEAAMKLIEQVDAMKKGGMDIKDAEKKVGLPVNGYFQLNRRIRGLKKKSAVKPKKSPVQVVQYNFPADQGDRMILAIGSAANISKALESLGQILRG